MGTELDLLLSTVMMDSQYVELHMHSPYSFLDGASDLETLILRAAQFGMPALALTDHNTAAAAVKFTEICQGYAIKPILGAELTMEDHTHLTLLARNREGYAHLCRLITAAHTHGGRLTPRLPWRALGIEGWEVPDCGMATNLKAEAEKRRRGGEESGAHSPLPLTHLICLSGCRRGALASLIRRHDYAESLNTATRLREAFGAESFFIELQDDLTPDCARVNRELSLLARHLGVGVVATNNVHFATRDDYITHEILRCVATKTTREEIHPDKPLNSERHLKHAQDMAELFAWKPEALENTLRIAEQCEPGLPEQIEVTPGYPIPEKHENAAAYLKHLALKGGRARYRLDSLEERDPKLAQRIKSRIEHELSIICELGFADYFLMCWEIVRWARKQGIRCTGRGSAADSCVAYCLTLTDVDVIRRNLPFARFLTPGKLPDIDMDFPSENRDDVFRYIVQKYGEEHVGMVCTFHTYWAKGAVRDIGKVLSIPPEALEWLSNNLTGFMRADQVEEAFGRYAELRPYQGMKERFKTLFELCGRIAGFPRHIGTHSSGIVISREPLANIAPLQPSARGLTRIWELDKDDAESLGAIKFDVLSLRMLSAIQDSERDIKAEAERRGGEEETQSRFSYDRIPFDDPATFRMIRAGKAIGTFQHESAAQMALAVTLQPEHFEDLVAAVALIRPGPIQGNVVHRFVACRNGWARADVLHPCLAEVLDKTYGCVVFQEQVNEVVRLMTGCSDAEADKFRKSITQYTKLGTMQKLKDQFIERACAYRTDFHPERAERLWEQIQGWAGYGFTEGHAASFALTGYRSAYLSVHYPAEFYAGLMNHQPMGFFNANTLAAEARRRGVQILPVDINQSRDKSVSAAGWSDGVQDSTSSPLPPSSAAIRLGLRMVSELREEDIKTIESAREQGGPYASLMDFCVRVPMHRDRLENLILAGAFDSLHEHRRGLLWRLDETLGTALSYRAESPGGHPTAALNFGAVRSLATPIAWDIADFSVWDKFLWTWRLTGVCAECHVFAHLREELKRCGIMTAYEALRLKHGARTTVAGLNIRPHRPRTVSGNPVLFTLLEDETEMLQVTVLGEAIWETTTVFLTSAAVVVEGVIERRGTGAGLRLEKARPLRMQEFARQSGDLITAPPATRTYPGTKLRESVAASN